jgi:hypothetical protein
MDFYIKFVNVCEYYFILLVSGHLRSTQPLTEMSTKNLPGGKEWVAHKADNRAAVYELIVWKMWEP